MLSIDEAIVHAREVASVQKDKCEQCAKDHEQLAEWLEELKDLRQGRADEGAKMIDEFVKAIEKHQTRKESYFGPFYMEMSLDMTDVLEVAEQLKEKKHE